MVGADAVAALGAVAAVGAVVWVVLRDVMSYDRPPPVPRPVVAVERTVVEPVVEPDDGSILSGLTSIEHDERSPLRRVGAALVLLTLTLVTAGLVGAGIYRAVAGLK